VRSQASQQPAELTALGSTDEGAKPIVTLGITATAAMQATTIFLRPHASCQHVCANEFGTNCYCR